MARWSLSRQCPLQWRGDSIAYDNRRKYPSRLLSSWWQFKIMLPTRLLTLSRCALSVLMRIQILALLPLVFAGCHRTQIGDLIGIYRFQSETVQETVELRSGGVSRQEIITNGRTYRTEGEWTFEAPRTVVFRRHFLARFDGRQPIDPPKEYSYFEAYWESAARRIIFDESDKHNLPQVAIGERNPPAIQIPEDERDR
jgi:hypothetical protein